MEERVAHFADIDTRRAMGVPPRRLVMPDLHLRFPCIREVTGQGYGPPKPLAQQNLKLPVSDTTRRIYNYFYEVDFNNGIRLDIYHTHEIWQFTEVSFDNVWHTSLGSTEDGRIWWCFGMRKYLYERP
jgi:hypothetical protein